MELKDLRSARLGFNKNDVCKYLSKLYDVYEQKETQKSKGEREGTEIFKRCNKGMNSCRSFYKRLSLCIIFVLTLLSASLPIYAAVYTVASDSADVNTVYVAGNPDAYPLEYYSKEKKAFCGVFPDMLKAVSEKTKISFTYISASDQNLQKELSRNNQVEIVTALLTEQDECDVTEILPVLETSAEGEERIYGIGFTEIASPELVGKIKTAFSEISEEEKLGYLLVNSNNNPEINSKNRLIKIIIFSSAALFVISCGVIVIVETKRKKHSIQDLQIDQLTGIGNAKYYNYAFEQLISRQSKNLYAVIYLACEIEKIGAEYGEKTIEEIERYAAAHLNSKIFSAEYLARVNDGVFVMLIQALTEKECASKAAAVVDSLNLYIRKFYPSMANIFKAGVSRLCEHPDCNAETAFYNAKQGYLAALRKGDCVEITDEKELAQSKKREKLYGSINKAVNDGEFRVYLQFINENKSGKICGAEVLSRWENKEYGMLRPAEYIDILKESGQIIAHDYKMFSFVCRQLEAWCAEPYNRVFLTCNFTRDSLSQNDFFDRITEISSGYEFDRSRLVIEITEDSIAENSRAVSENIRKCRENGFKIAIDDMGEGFSSFADIYDNEIDLVKIDGKFISSCTSERQQTMLSNIITLVCQSGAKVLYEGVENLNQAKFLSKINCDMMQGFYFSKILPLVECEKFLKNENITEESVF